MSVMGRRLLGPPCPPPSAFCAPSPWDFSMTPTSARSLPSGAAVRGRKRHNGAAPSILGVRLSPVSVGGAVRRILETATRHESAVVCLANVHMLMEAYDDPSFEQQLNSADLVLPDGM